MDIIAEDERETLRLAAIAEKSSAHPLGEAILKAAKEISIELKDS